MNVVVTGGRNYWGRKRVFKVLDEVQRTYGVTLLAHGACTDTLTGELSGADRWADEWALEHGLEPRRFPADWKRSGPAAGPLRNKAMLQEVRPGLVVAFPGGRGTLGCAELAENLGFKLWTIDWSRRTTS